LVYEHKFSLKSSQELYRLVSA